MTRAQSQSEATAQVLSAVHKTVFIGSATAGANGEGSNFPGIDPGRRRASFNCLVPYGSRHNDLAKERRKDVEKPDAREVDER